MVKTVVELTDKQKLLFSNMRGSNYDVVTYLSEEEILSLLKSIGVERYAYLTHDKDLNADGTLKKSHTHLVLCFSVRKRATNLVRLFNTTELRVIETEKQLKGSFKYLTHETESAIKQGKVKYEKSKLRCNDLEYFDNLSDCELSVDNSLDIVDKINMGVSTRDLVRQYGKDFIFHYGNYRAIAEQIFYEDNLNKKRLVLEPCIDKETGEVEQIEF